MDSVLIPVLTRHTSSGGPQWMAVSSPSSTPASKHFCERISHRSFQRAEVSGRGVSHFPPPGLRVALLHPAFLLPGCYLCLAVPLPQFFVCRSAFLYKYIYTHPHVAIPGSLRSTLVCPLEIKWMASPSLIWDGKCRHFISFSVNSGVNRIFPCLLKKKKPQKTTTKTHQKTPLICICRDDHGISSYVERCNMLPFSRQAYFWVWLF